MNEVATLARTGREMEEPVYESLFNRFVAALIDNAVWFIGIFYVLGYLPADVYEDHPEAVGIAVIVLLSLWFNYFAFAEWRWGQTIGKNAMGMRVTTVDGERISFSASAKRNLLRLVDWLVVGWVMIAATKRHQRLGDKVAKTVVVRKRRGGGGGEPSGAAAAPTTITAPAAEPEKETRDRGALPEITWSLGDTVWAVIGGMLLAVLFAPLLVLPFDPDLDSLGALLVAQALLDGTLILVALGMASGWNLDSLGASFERLGLSRFKPSTLGVTLLTLLAYYGAAIAFATLVVEPEQEDIGGELGLDEGVVAAIAAVVLIAVLAPIAEEAFFRGFFFAGLRGRLSLWPAALISGVLFGAIHAPTGLTAVVPLSMFGVALAWLYQRTGSLWPPIIAHAINNGLALAVVS